VVYFLQHDVLYNSAKLWIPRRFCPLNWLPRQRPLTDRKQLQHLQPQFYHCCKLGEDRSGRCSDMIGLTEIVKKDK